MLLIEGQPGPVHALAFSPDGETLAISGRPLRLWTSDGEVPLSFPLGGTLSVAFSADGRLIASGDDQRLHVWDASTRSLAASSPMQPHPVTSCGFVGGSILFGIGERANPVARPTTLLLIDAPYAKPRRFPFDVVNGIRALATLPERKVAAWATDNKLLRVQDVSRPPSKAHVLRNDCRALALSPDGRWLAVTSDWDTLVFNLSSWPSAPRTVGRHQGVVACLAFDADGRRLFTGGGDGVVRAWSLDTGAERESFRWPIGDRVTALAVSPDGLRAAAGGTSGGVAVWDLD